MRDLDRRQGLDKAILLGILKINFVGDCEEKSYGTAFIRPRLRVL
jgi:hypothetical protein